jgi:hypothetical protein
MIIKILFIILLVPIIFVELAQNKTNIYTCIIKNIKYSQNLYVSDDKHNFLQNVKFSKDHLLDSLSSERKVYTYPYALLNSLEKMQWTLIEVNSKANKTSFLIKNTHFDEYLCSSSHFASDLFRKRRYVITIRADAIQNLNHCIWRIEKISYTISKHVEPVVYDVSNEQDFKSPMRNRFLIWNLHYSEPLFAASSFFNMIQFGRSVYTWRNRNPDSDQFFWTIYCI